MKDPVVGATKENAFTVGSSLTGFRHDVEKDTDPGSSSYKENEESCPLSSQQGSLNRSVSLNGSRNAELNKTRYFIIKSLNHQNIQRSVENGIWATQVMNEPILEEAFHASDRVILIFSVNMSGFFQGYAQMMSSVGWRRDNVWSESSGGHNPWGRSFKVKWLRLNNLPFQKTLHLKNPLNDFKPVKISRDCQELSHDIGQALCALIDGDGKLKRNCALRDESLVKRHCRESQAPLSDEVSWAKAPMIYPSVLRQNAVLAVASSMQITQVRSSGEVLSDSQPLPFELQDDQQSNVSRVCGNLSDFNGKSDAFFTVSQELSDGDSSLSNSLWEEDLLDMTYEEYLQRHGKNYETCTRVGPGPSRTLQGSSGGAKMDDDGYAKYLADWYRSRQKTMQGYSAFPAHKCKQ